MLDLSSTIYRLSRWILGMALGFYFSRIERFHPERVPLSGPLLFTSNHPNSLTDAFVIGASIPRKVNFVGTVQLFRWAPLGWFLTRCGVIAVNRVKDDPKAMRTVLATFEACYRVLEKGEAVAIFPEGITHDDPQLKEVKTGAARMALELEHRHKGSLGLQIVPVGLTFSAKDRYRSEVLVNFGEPIRVADLLPQYESNKHASLQHLTAQIEQRIASLILHLNQLERRRLVEAVRRLYLDRLQVANRVVHEPMSPRAGELALMQAIVRAVDFTCEQHPEKAQHFAGRLARFESFLHRLNLSEEELAHFPDPASLLGRSVARALAGLFLLPVATAGWVHRFAPYLVVRFAIDRFATKSARTQISTTTMLAGAVSFTLFYGLYIVVFYALFGWPATLWYALALPIVSILAHYYARETEKFLVAIKFLFLRLRVPGTIARLVKMREELIEEIDAARWEVPQEALSPGKGST